MAMLTASPGLPPEEGAKLRQQGVQKMEKMFADFKAKNWAAERKDYGDTRCYSLAPPAGDTSAPKMSGCFAEKKRTVLSVGVMSGTRNPSIDQAKALIDKAVARLP